MMVFYGLTQDFFTDQKLILRVRIHWDGTNLYHKRERFWGRFLLHITYDYTSLQNSVLLHDIFHTVCEKQVSFGEGNARFVALLAEDTDMILCSESHANDFLIPVPCSFSSVDTWLIHTLTRRMNRSAKPFNAIVSLCTLSKQALNQRPVWHHTEYSCRNMCSLCIWKWRVVPLKSA